MKLKCVVFAAIGLNAIAQTPDNHINIDTLQLADIEVTAIKQSASSVQGASVTTLSRRQVEQNALLGSKTMAEMVPNLFIPDYGSRMTSTIYVRGIGARIDQPAMGLNIDNVPVLCKENYDFDLLDISRMEMLRGPQSILYGRNTMGGVMNIYMLSPLNYQGTRLLAEYGSHNAWKAGASHYHKFGERLGLSATAYYTSTDGSHRNQYNGHLTNWEHQGSGRLKLEWLPADSWHVSNIISLSVSRQGGYPYEYTATGQISYNDTCFYRRTAIMDGLTIQKRNARYTLSSITSYQYLNDNMTLDQDFTPLPYFTLTQARKEHAVTEDIVARSHRGNAYQWTLGTFGYYRHMKMQAPVTFKDTGIAELIEGHRNEAMPNYPIRWDERHFVLGSDFTMPTWGAALYHQSSYRWGHWTFVAGLRLDYEHATLRYHSHTHTGYSITKLADGSTYAHNDIDIDDHGTLKKDFVQLLPKFNVTYHVSNHASLNLTVSKGSKAGGFNTQMFSDVLQQRLMGMMGIGASYDIDQIVGYRPEKAWNYELGVHWTGCDGRLTTDASVFYLDCRDRQLTIFPDGTTTGRVMTNAGKTRSVGGELSVHALPWSGGDLLVNYGFTDARFVEYNDGKADYNDRHVPYSPQHTLYAQVLHTFSLNGGDWAHQLTLDAHVRGAGEIYWNEANTMRQPFYALLGASVTLAGKHYSLQLWGRNLTDTRFSTFYFVSIGHEFLQRGQGRTMGATLRIHL